SAASSAAAAGSSRAQGSSGTSSGDAGRRRLLRGDGTLVSEPAAKRQRSSEGAGQGSSRTAGPHGPSGATGPPPSPPRNSSRRQQEQQQQLLQEQRQQARGRQQQQQVRPRVAPMPQPQGQQQREQARVAPASQLQGQQQQQQPLEKRPGLRGRWVPGTSGLVSFYSPPLCRCSVFFLFLMAFLLCNQGFPPQRFLYHRWHIGRCPGGGGPGVDSDGGSRCGTLRYGVLCQPHGAWRGADWRAIFRLCSAQCGSGGGGA